VADYPLPNALAEQPPFSVTRRMLGAAACGVVAGIAAAILAPWQTVPLLAWCATALVWITLVWSRIATLNAEATSAYATAEEPARATVDTILLSASVISLVGVVFGVIKAGNAHGGEKAILLTAGVVAIVASWGVVHTLFTLRYADLYYTGADGGIDFKEDSKPDYADFAYLAFTIGMTYQVSDTDLQTKEIRHTALRHALLSYLFGTVIIAATINLAAGLVK
jgi:uncharacterized membrane protein